MIEIKKTYKNYVGGKYIRSESGKTFTLNLKNDSFELPLTSKKDIRDAVTSSKATQLAGLSVALLLLVASVVSTPI